MQLEMKVTVYDGLLTMIPSLNSYQPPSLSLAVSELGFET